MVRLSKPTPAPKAASYLRPWNWTKCAHHTGMEPRILPPTLFSLHLRHIHWQTLCHTTQQQLTASPETYTSGTHGTAGVNCKPSSPTKNNPTFCQFWHHPLSVAVRLFLMLVRVCVPMHALSKMRRRRAEKMETARKIQKKLGKTGNNKLFHNFQWNFENQCVFFERWLGRATLSVVFFFSPLALGASARKLRTEKMEPTRKFQKFCSKCGNLALFRKILQNFENQCGFFER